VLDDVKEMNFSPEEQRVFALRLGDVLVTEGSGSRETVGAPAVWDDSLPGPVCFQNTLVRLRSGPELEQRYLYWWARHAHASGLIAEAAGGQSILHIGAETIRDLEVYLPSLEEQRRIADFLDDQVTRIDNIIAARQQQVDLVVAWATARFAELIFQPGIPLARLSALAEIRLGRQRSPANEQGAHMTRYLRSANVFDGRFDLSDVKEMNFDPKERTLLGLRRGDILVTEGAGSPEAVGASAMWDEDSSSLCFQNTLLRVRPRDASVAPEYLAWWARTSHRSGAMRAFSSGAGILHLGAEGLKRMPIPSLNQREQRSAVGACQSVEQTEKNAFASLSSSARLLLELKRSLVSAAVSGEFDVSSASGRGVPA